jgi:serine/threonine protein kinase
MYIAPEILLSTKKRGYKGFPVDIWSSGIALYILLSGTLPFDYKNKKSTSVEDTDKNNDDNNSEELQYSIINHEPKYIESISAQAKDLLKGLLNKNPEKRLTCEQILSHPWLKDIDIDGDNSKYHLFTKAEMKLLCKTYVDYRKDKNENLKENFTLSNLFTDNKDKNCKDDNKNDETKSSVLAPFNSVNYDEEEEESSNGGNNNINMEDCNNSKIKFENGIIGFSSKVQEINMFYEMNNNCEIDNGIIINSQTNTISSVSNNSVHSYHNTFSKKDFEEKKKVKKIDKKKYSYQSSLYKNKKGDKNNNNKEILNKLEELGYDKNYVNDCIKNNILCHASTAYYLMMNYDKI